MLSVSRGAQLCAPERDCGITSLGLGSRHNPSAER